MFYDDDEDNINENKSDELSIVVIKTIKRKKKDISKTRSKQTNAECRQG